MANARKNRTSQAEDNLTPIQISRCTADLLSEIGQHSQFSLPQMFDKMFDYWFVEQLLTDYINPEQVIKAETFKDRCKLAIGFLRAMRGVPGYDINVQFGPYIVYEPETAEVEIAV